MAKRGKYLTHCRLVHKSACLCKNKRTGRVRFAAKSRCKRKSK